MTIFVLEDDTDIRELLLYTLKSAGYTAHGFDRATPFFSALESTQPALILLDIMLPEQDGLSVLRQLRSTPATQDLPVIMLTAKSAEIDKVQGLDLGADDYITKPFGTMELLSRIRALLRRVAAAPASPLLSAASLSLNPQNYTAELDGKSLDLTLVEFELLAFLLRHPRQVFTRHQLLDQVWGYDYHGETRTVDVHVASLRQKLGDYGDYLQTVRGVGYGWEDDHD